MLAKSNCSRTGHSGSHQVWSYMATSSTMVHETQLKSIHRYDSDYLLQMHFKSLVYLSVAPKCHIIPADLAVGVRAHRGVPTYWIAFGLQEALAVGNLVGKKHHCTMQSAKWNWTKSECGSYPLPVAFFSWLHACGAKYYTLVLSFNHSTVWWLGSFELKLPMTGWLETTNSQTWPLLSTCDQLSSPATPCSPNAASRGRVMRSTQLQLGELLLVEAAGSAMARCSCLDGCKDTYSFG